MRIVLKNGGFVGADNCTFYEIYSIDIDEDDHQMDLNDEWGYQRGMIYYKEAEQIIMNHYDGEEQINEFDTILVENGKLVYKGD